MKGSVILGFLSVICLSFVSCGPTGILKRHYTKGYYVAHKKQLRSPVLQPNRTEVADISARNVGTVSKTEAAYPFRDPTAKILTCQADVKHPVKTIPYKNFTTVHTTPVIWNTRMAAKIGQGLYQSETLRAHTSSDVLSLLWIVIVVILILWLIGFLLGGFGLGNLIHLLLVVALILLILWLLRII